MIHGRHIADLNRTDAMNQYAVTMKFGNGETATKLVMASDRDDAQDLAIDECDVIGIPSGEIVSIKRV